MPDKWKLMIQTHPCGDRAHPRSSDGGLSLYPGGAFAGRARSPRGLFRCLMTFHEVGFRGAERRAAARPGRGPVCASRKPNSQTPEGGRCWKTGASGWVSRSVTSLSGPEPPYGAIRSHPVASGSAVRARQPGMASGFRLLSPAPASLPLLHNPVFSL
jgi:hypothetical protein